MEIMSCATGAWYPFRDPDIEEESRLRLLKSNIDADVERKTIHRPSVWETSELTLRRLLRSNGYDVQRALVAWREWVMWRKSLDMDNITAEDIKYEISSGIAFWKGKDKSGQPTLVLTGRMMDPMTRRGDLTSFKKFMVRMIEHGCCLADEAGQETFSILYDRRGLGYEHIDPILHQLTRTTADSLRNFYGPRLGNIYIVHANWFFWGIYLAIIRPFLVVISSSMRDKVHLLNDEKEKNGAPAKKSLRFLRTFWACC